MPDFTLSEPRTGEAFDSRALADREVAVVVFASVHCPHSRAWQSRILDVATAHADRVGMVLICSNDAGQIPADRPESVAEHARALAISVPWLSDPQQVVADEYGALRTPDVFVFDRKRNLVYHGTVDDNEDEPSWVTASYFRDAVKAVLDGRQVPVAETTLVGCGIKRRAVAARPRA
jgi:peroxiredoxin